MKDLYYKYFDKEHRAFLKWVFTLAIPIMIQDLISNSVNLVDQLMIGNLGSESITAVGLANQVFFIMILICFGVVSGASTLVGQYWGKKNDGSDPSSEIRKVVGISLTLNLTVALIFFTAANIIPEAILDVYSDDPEVIRIGSEYLRVVSLTFFLSPISITLSSVLRSTQNTKTPMYCSSASIITNVTLNYIFIYVLGYGVVGAGVATVIARIVELTLLIIGLKVNDHIIYCNIKEFFKYDKEIFVKYINIATPVILNEMTWVIGVSLYNVAYGRRGTDAQASVMMAQSIKNFFQVAGMSVGTTATIILSNTIGNKEVEKAKVYAARYMRLTVGIAFVMVFVLLGTAPFVLSVYEVSETVINMAYINCMIFSVTLIFQTHNYTGVVGVLRSGGDNKFNLLIDVFGVWVCAVPLSFGIAFFTDLPIYAIVLATGFEEFSKVIFIRRRIKSGKWINILV